MFIGTIKEDHMKIKYYPDADVLEMRITDDNLDYGVQASDEIILHYSKDDKLVKIEMLDASKTDINETEWLQAAAKNLAFDFLKDPKEDIYTLSDGRPFHDEE